MFSFGRVWFRNPPLLRDEVVLWSCWANRLQTRLRAVGGTLILTSKRLLFVANRLESQFGGTDVAIPRDSIVGVAAERFGLVRPAGGLRQGVCFALSDGSKERFMINKVGARIDILSKELEAK